jgi:hypothetical protein
LGGWQPGVIPVVPGSYFFFGFAFFVVAAGFAFGLAFFTILTSSRLLQTAAFS